MNNPDVSDVSLVSLILNSDPKAKYIFQAESGENKTEHFQGVIQFSNQRDFNSVKQLLGNNPHIEKCKNLKASIAYCSKQETRIRGPWACGFPMPPKDPLDGIELKHWQQEIMNYINEPINDREILWIYDAEGGKGKTSLAKHLVLTKNALVVGGKATDIKHGIAATIDNNGSAPKLLIINLTRTTEKFISYEALETIKDGLFFSGKYEGKMVVYDPPHVIVFANCMPETDKLTPDRWNIMTI